MHTLVLLAACSVWPDLGDDALDQVALADAPAFAHVADAAETDATTVAELLDAIAGGVEFTSAPDPSDYLDAQLDTAEPLAGTELTVLSYNVGLLDRNYLFTNVSVPEIETRRAAAGELIAAQDYDIVLLQEVWEWEDAQAIASAGEAAGYEAWLGTEKVLEETGVLILVKGDWVGDGGEQVEDQYTAQYGAEHSPGPNLKRGFKRWSFPLAGTDREVWLFDTHLTAFQDQWLPRTAQARELGLLVQEAPDDALVIVGGDLNAGPYYPRDVWLDGEDKEHDGWWSNTAMYPTLLHYGGLTDAVSVIAGSSELDAYDALPSDGIGYLDAPYGDASLCDEVLPDWFTATDCNTLHFDNYAGQEFPARLDHVLFRDDTGGTRVADAELVFVDAEPSLSMELSDHSGVLITFLLEDGTQ